MQVTTCDTALALVPLHLTSVLHQAISKPYFQAPSPTCLKERHAKTLSATGTGRHLQQGCYSCHPAQHSMQLFYSQETRCGTSAQLGPQRDELRACTPPAAHRQLRATEAKALGRRDRARPGSLRPMTPPRATSARDPEQSCPAGAPPEPGGRRGSPRPSPQLRQRGTRGGGKEKGRRRAPPPHTPPHPSAAPLTGPREEDAGREPKRCLGPLPRGTPQTRAAAARAAGQPPGPGLPAAGPAVGQHGTAERGPARRRRAAATAARHFLRQPNFAGRSRPGRRRRAEPPPR